MAWNLIFWFISFCIIVALLVLNFYQLLVLTDLEADYLNIYDCSSRINKLVIPEFLVQGVFCSLFLLTGHWFMFLITVPVSCYHINLFLKREHLIDVTEVFRALKREKYFRLAKLIFYLLLFLIVIFRIIMVAGMKSVFDSAPDDIYIRSTVLEFLSLLCLLSTLYPMKTTSYTYFDCHSYPPKLVLRVLKRV